MATPFTTEYALLLIKQYFSKPKARAEIELMIGQFEKVYEILRQFPDKFDVDLAVGDQLDKVGKIVGISRNVAQVLAKIAFGFDDNANAKGFANKFGVVDAAPFYDKFTPPYTDQQLNDFTFRRMIKAKIAVNNTSAFMASDERTSIQQVIQQAFNGEAYVIDKKAMTLWLYVSPSVNLDQLRLILALKLLPKPQGVRYSVIIQAAPSMTFGFADNANSLGFGDSFNPGASVGVFASKVIF